ncbi:hypothetical protein TNCV_956911 [Trichonephila clavipes]|nr:hypothetical protein TNCV_956911 [Trichonephila clavipes]
MTGGSRVRVLVPLKPCREERAAMHVKSVKAQYPLTGVIIKRKVALFTVAFQETDQRYRSHLSCHRPQRSIEHFTTHLLITFFSVWGFPVGRLLFPPDVLRHCTDLWAHGSGLVKLDQMGISPTTNTDQEDMHLIYGLAARNA